MPKNKWFGMAVACEHGVSLTRSRTLLGAKERLELQPTNNKFDKRAQGNNCRPAFRVQSALYRAVLRLSAGLCWLIKFETPENLFFAFCSVIMMPR